MIGTLELVAAILLGWTVALIGIGAAFFYLGGKLARARRRRQARDGWRPLSDEEVADSLAPFGADISIWPSRAPRNGSTHETTEVD